MTNYATRNINKCQPYGQDSSFTSLKWRCSFLFFPSSSFVTILQPAGLLKVLSHISSLHWLKRRKKLTRKYLQKIFKNFAMEFTSVLDTSLDLNTKPPRIFDDNPVLKQEVPSDFIQLGRNVAVKEEKGALMEELKRVNAENRKLTELLTVICENYNELKKQLTEYTSKNLASKKRKAESSINNGNINHGINSIDDSSSSDEDSSKKPREEHIKAQTSRVYVRAEASDTSIIVKDGYQWRKYGQKVTRDNPSPRAYFKCSFAPTCPVKKKVQRSIDDQSILVATYEGEHNHLQPSKIEAASGSNRSMTLSKTPTSVSSSGATVALDLTKPKQNTDNARNSIRNNGSPEFQQYFVEQMASSLTKDPNFTASLAAAISGKFLQKNPQTGKW